jgi:outer membrane protein assembly factor BamB
MADWPQYRGPSRSGISPETFSGRFAGGGPRRLWEAQVGVGYAGVAVKGGRAFTTGNVNNTDVVSCLNAANGRVLWQARFPCGAGDIPGTRATPTIHAGNVYGLTREGLAYCLSAVNGRVVWQQQVGQRTGAPIPKWGFSGSPLISGRLVFYNIGGSGAALDKLSGRIVWHSGNGLAGYASPTPFAGGVAIFAGKELVAVQAATGRRLWAYPWETSHDVNAADPIFWGSTVFISSNYGRGGALLRISGGQVSPVWENRSMKNHFNTSVLLGGYLYGNSENTLMCLDARTGAEKWGSRGIDKGGLLAVNGKLLVLTGRGELLSVAVNPNAYTELGRAQVLNGTCWTAPSLSAGVVYCRSHEGTLVALKL